MIEPHNTTTHLSDEYPVFLDCLNDATADHLYDNNGLEFEDNSSEIQPFHFSDIATHHIGDLLREQKPAGTIRFYGINLNGIKWDKDGGNWPDILQAMEASNVDVMGIAEINQDVGRYALMKKMNSICSSTFQHHRLIMSTTKQPVRRTYKPGGTGVLACNSMTTLIHSWSRDRMGRWTDMRFSCDNGRFFRFIMAYQVCKGQSRGTNTATNQQHATLIQESIEQDQIQRVTPRQAFIRDLRLHITEAQASGDSVILCGDFNETMSETRSGIADLAGACGLVDLFGVRLNTNEEPVTYQRGKKRLDFVLISASLMPSVSAAGYDPFGYRINSDHRGFFIDFNADLLCGYAPPPLASLNKRDFQSTNRMALRKYIQKKSEYLANHKWYQRLQNLMTTGTPNHGLAESLDRDLTRASRTGANACSFSYRSPWSPQFAEAWAKINFYKMAKTQTTSDQNYGPALIRLQECYSSLPKDIPTDPIVIAKSYKEAISHLQQLRHEGQELRDKHLQSKIEQYQNLEDKQREQAVRQLKRAEDMSRVYRKLKFMRHGEQLRGLASLRVPRDPSITDPEQQKALPDGEEYWRTERIPTHIEQLLLARNRRHFGQAQGTPFTQPPLNMQVQYTGDGIVGERILQGTYTQEDLSEPTQLFIQHLQRKSLTSLSGKINPQDVIGKLKTWPERTTTSPSGLHLGHYHAVWRTTGCLGGEDDPEGQQILDQQASLLHAQTQMLQYALTHGYSYARWAQVVNVMLEKDPGDPKIHRLRVIHIYEADYNMLLAIKWREALHHCEDNKLLNDGLYGSRPGRSAITPVNIEIHQHAIYQLSMKSGVNLDLDATSCYDRILANIASLSSRRMGMDAGVVLVNSATLQAAKFKIKTILGVSAGWYSHCDEFPIHGTGQGSGNSPTIWCFVCSALFDALETKASGAVFVSPNQQHSVRIRMIGFVDDCSQRVNQFSTHPQPSPRILIQQMQKEGQLWNDLLWASGGSLERKKCSFHLIESSWNANGVPFLRSQKDAPPLYITNEQHDLEAIRQVSNYHPHKTLGCHIEPAMTMTTQTKILRKKNDQFRSLLQMNCFSRVEAWTFYTSTYLPAMTYPFPNIIVTEAGGRAMDQQLMRELVPRCGFNRNMSLAVRFAPHKLGGAGFRKLYHEWGMLVVLEMIKNLRTIGSIQQKMTVVGLSWCQHYLGTSMFFLEEPSEPIPPCPCNYYMAIRKFLTVIDGQICLQENLALPELRINDRHIMDLAMVANMKRSHIDSVNACRRYLQATTMSDIVDDKGTYILEECWDGTRVTRSDSYNGELFNQQKPGSKAWGSWRSFLRKLCSSGRRLTLKLGDWKCKADKVRHHPMWIFNPAEATLYKKDSPGGYRQCRTIRRFIYGPPQSTPPECQTQGIPDGYPVWVISTGEGYCPMTTYSENVPRTSIPNEFRNYVRSLPAWEIQLLEHCQLLASPQDIMWRLNAGGIIAASDGSVKSTRATFGFVICDRHHRRLIRGRGQAPGCDPNSLRAEAYGVLAVLRMLFRLSEFTSTPIGKAIQNFTDSKSLIARIELDKETSWRSPSQTIKPEWDVINEIGYSTRNIQPKTILKWVKGHQDSDKPSEHLSPEAQMNCDADRLAEEQYQVLSPRIAEEPMLPHNPVKLCVGGKSITGRYKTAIRVAAAKPDLQKFLCHQFQWDSAMIDDFSWETFSQIIQRFYKQHGTVVKHVNGIAPTGHIAHRNKSTLSSGCPACSCELETNMHLLTCPAESRRDWKNQTLQKMKKCREHTSDPILKDILLDGLLGLHSDKHGVDQSAYPLSYRHLILRQNALGWDQVYRGRWVKEWELKHLEYAKDKVHWKSKETHGRGWVVAMGQLLLAQWLQLWKIRNQERHGKDVEQKQKVRFDLVSKELHALYAFRTQVVPVDRSIFYDSAKQHIRKHPDLGMLEDWIHTHRRAIEMSVNQAKHHGLQFTRTIDAYFRPTETQDRELGLLAHDST